MSITIQNGQNNLIFSASDGDIEAKGCKDELLSMMSASDDFVQAFNDLVQFFR